MNKCKTCNNDINDGGLYTCHNCGASFCAECNKKTQSICPNCYHDLEISG